MKKRFFLSLSALLLILSWSSSDAGNLGPISCWAAECIFVWTDGNIYDQAWNLWHTATGAVLVANPDNTAYYWASGTTAPFYFNNLGPGLDVSWNFNAQYYVRENGDVWWGTTYAPHSLEIVGANAKLVDGAGDPGSWLFKAWYIRADWTSNVCSWSDNVEIANISTWWDGYWMCRKSDWTLETNYPWFDSAWVKFKHVSGSRYGSTAWCWIKDDNTVHCQGMSAPSGTFRDVSVKGTDMACAARVSDSAFVCWDFSATILVETGSTANPFQPIPPPWPAVWPNWSTCKTVTVPDTAHTEWMSPGFFSIPSSSDSFTWEPEASVIPSDCHTTAFWQAWWGWKRCWDLWRLVQSDSSQNRDQVVAYNYYTGSILVPNSFTASGTSRSLLIRDDSVWVPVLKFSAIRDWNPYAANVWEFYWVQNPSTSRNWAYEIWADWSSTPIFATWGTAQLIYWGWRSAIVLQLNETAVAPKGMRIWISSANVSKVQCTNANRKTACEWNRATLSWALSCQSVPYNGYVWQCAVDGNWWCIPSSTGSTVPLDGAYVQYWPNGEIIATTPEGSKVDGSGKVNSANVFSCPNTPKWFVNWVDCLLEAAKNVFDLATDSGKNLTWEGTWSVLGIAKNVWQQSGNLAMTWVSYTWVNLADTVARHVWNESFSDSYNPTFWGFGRMMLVWSLILLILTIVIMILIAAKRGNN